MSLITDPIAEARKFAQRADGYPRVELQDVCEIQLGKMLSPKARTGRESRPYLRNLNVQWNRFDLKDIAEMDFDEDEKRKFSLRTGDVLVCEGGEPGRAAIWEGQIANCYYQKALIRLRPKDNRVISPYIVFRMWAGSISGEFFSSHGKTTIAHLPAMRLARLSMPLPPPEVQRRIVAMLDRQMALAERASAFARQQQGLIDDFVGAMLREAFHSIVPLSIDPNEAEQAPPDWRWVRLTDVARLESGHTPSRRHPEWWGGEIPWLALPDIRALHGTVAMTTTENTNEAGIANSSARVLPKDTVALSRTASVGFVTIMGRPMATSQDFVNWVCGPALEPWFLLYALMASRDRLLSLSSGAIHKTIYMPTVESFHVCAPSIETQRIIVKKIRARLALYERMKRRAAEEADAISAMPRTILRRVFGEVA